jgi:hypothetical protein
MMFFSGLLFSIWIFLMAFLGKDRKAIEYERKLMKEKKEKEKKENEKVFNEVDKRK